MALCKDLSSLRVSTSAVFDHVIRVGTDVTYEGIYRCIGCNMEMAAIGGKPFPNPRQRPHTAGCPDQRWQLLVSATPAKPPSP